MHFCTRNARYPRAPRLAGELGALEPCGSLVLSTVWALDAFRVGRLNARVLHAALRTVSPADTDSLVVQGGAAHA
jgi:hypothetical protein